MSATAEHAASGGFSCKECGHPDGDCCCDLCRRCMKMTAIDTGGQCAECLTEHAEHLADVRSGR